ncbi:succinate dehydrogenase hydrophobic membrane anchor subunit [Gryllotalpicola koreensis]|uniref:Succinate dehydrogenase, hydrophobic membrane anchor protein n=1 Tax=Gryllotalpicola koreensis TaxID=993086 RepID=A0ABP8A138_9MICO
MSATIESPRTPVSPRKKSRTNWEKWGWIYMRVSGVVLVILIFGHLFVNLVAGQGIAAIDWAFVAGKWANPFWRIWDGLMLWLALIHGGNGMRTLVNDYAHNVTVNRVLKWAILLAVVILIILGTYTVTAFDPCPTDPSLSFCK